MFLPNSQQLSFLVRKQAFLRRYRLIFGQKLQGFFKMPPVPGDVYKRQLLRMSQIDEEVLRHPVVALTGPRCV